MTLDLCICKHEKSLHNKPEHGGTICNIKDCECGNFIRAGVKCNICARYTLKFKHRSSHHIVPKSLNGKKKVILCKACHSDLHTLFTNAQLAKMLFKTQREELLKRIYPKSEKL